MYRDQALLSEYPSKFVRVPLEFLFLGVCSFFIYDVFLFDKNCTQCHSFQTAPINHRSTGWLGLEGTSSSNAPSKQDHLEQSKQDHVQHNSEYLQERKLHSFSVQPFPVLCHHQSKKVFVCIQMEFPAFQFMSVAWHH